LENVKLAFVRQRFNITPPFCQVLCLEQLLTINFKKGPGGGGGGDPPAKVYSTNSFYVVQNLYVCAGLKRILEYTEKATRQ